jgi:hypothetical protein
MDRDGFLDLFVSNVSGGNFLYHNNGNGNRWLDVRLVGDISNRSGIGAKVRLLATIGGDSFWQLREIGARDGSGSPHTPEAHFGLGDATVVQTLRIEWPSGIVQELHDVAPGQLLTVHELPSIRIASASVMEGDQGPRPLVFTLSLTQPTNAPVTVDYFTVDREAAAGIDYVATNGTVVFAPNQTTQTLAITVLGDLEDETNETFLVVLTNSTVLPITSRQAVGTIIDDEPLTMTVGNVSATESSGVALVPRWTTTSRWILPRCKERWGLSRWPAWTMSTPTAPCISPPDRPMRSFPWLCWTMRSMNKPRRSRFTSRTWSMPSW